jgi:hypothetical protein
MPTPPPGALRRTLSRRDLIVYRLLFIGPLAPVGVFGVLEARTGGADRGSGVAGSGRRGVSRS